MARYIRDSEALGMALKQIRKIGREAARPTGTELNQTTQQIHDATAGHQSLKDRLDSAQAEINTALADAQSAQVVAEAAGVKAAEGLAELSSKLDTVRDGVATAQSTADKATVAAADAHNQLVAARSDLTKAQEDLTALAVQGDSVMPDPSFEQGQGAVPKLYGASIERVKEHAHQGEWSIRYTADGLKGNIFGAYSAAPVPELTPGRTYIVSAWVWCEAGVQWRIDFQNARPDGTYAWAELATTTTTTGQWEYIEATITVGEQGIRYWAGLRSETNTPDNKGKRIWVDELRFVDVTEQVARLKKLSDAASAAQQKADSAYQLAASKASQSDLVAVRASVNGKNSITISTGAPSGSGVATGDTWWRIDSSQQIYGQWTWTGTAWQAATIRSEVIANLDVNKLQVLTSASMSEAVVKKLFAEVIIANSAELGSLVVASPNVFPDPHFLNPIWGTRASEKYGKTNVLTLSANGTQNGAYYQPAGIEKDKAVTVEPGQQYYIRCWARFDGTQGVPYFSVYMRYARKDATTGLVLLKNLYRTPETSYAEGHLEGAFTTPTDMADGRCTVGFFVQATMPDGNVSISDVVIQKANASVQIADGAVTAPKIMAGAVTAEKLTADQAMVNKLITPELMAGKIGTRMLTAGDEFAGNVAISQAGVQVKGDSGGKVALTANGLEAYTPQGVKTVSITQNGDAQFTGTITGSTIILVDSAHSVTAQLTDSGVTATRGGKTLGTTRWDLLVQPPMLFGHIEQRTIVSNANNAPNGILWVNVPTMVASTKRSGGISIDSGWATLPVSGWYQVDVMTRFRMSDPKNFGLAYAGAGVNVNGAGISNNGIYAFSPILPNGTNTIVRASGARYYQAGTQICAAALQSSTYDRYCEAASISIRFISE